MLFLRSTSNQSDNLTNLVDVIATVMMLVHNPSLIDDYSSSEITNAFQRDHVVFVNRIVIDSSRDAVKAAARDIISVIIFAVLDDGMFNQFF